MFQQVVRWTFIITIWKKYKGQLLTTIGYLASLLLVSFVHQDYLEYLTASGEGRANVGLSFGLKWLAYITLTVCFYLIFTGFSNKTQRNTGHKGLGFLAKFRNASKNKNGASTQSAFSGYEQGQDQPTKTGTQSQTGPSAQSDDLDRSRSKGSDPFANIRSKEKLRSEADVMLDLNKKNEG